MNTVNSTFNIVKE